MKAILIPRVSTEEEQKESGIASWLMPKK